MARQLDILALEPFFGGVRRAMLETVVRYSRHRWTVLKLPPRRIERRLTAAANWFAEQLGRHWVGRHDLLFTSEAMNLASLLQLVPQLATRPSVVYFHDNQLPDLSMRGPSADDPLDLVNLNTAQAATEVWFNSSYHKQVFFILARSIVARHRELSTRDPMASIVAKTKLQPPPIDLTSLHDAEAAGPRPPRSLRTLFVETRDADVRLLNDAAAKLRETNVPFELVTVGPVNALDPAIDRITVSEHDDAGQVKAMLGAAAVISVKPSASSDYQIVRALAAGCRPILPDAGVYPELLPQSLLRTCLYPVDADSLADRITLALGPTATPWDPTEARAALKPFDAISQCRLIDERIEAIVAAHPPRQG